MPLTNAGRNLIARALVGTESQLFTEANSRIGVGDSVTAFNSAQTDLQGANTLRKAMEPGYPIVSGNTIKFKAAFGIDDANFPWNEWGVFNATSGGTMLNRVVEYNGTKQQGQTWIFEVDLVINIGA